MGSVPATLAIGFAVFAIINALAPATSAAINPARVAGPMLVQQIAGGHVKWEQLPVYVLAELLAGVATALVYGVLARTPAAGSTAGPGVDLADPKATADPDPTYAQTATA